MNNEVNLGNIYLSNQFNLRNLRLKSDQSKITNYAKRTQFPKTINIYNLNRNKELQRKMNNGLLVKTNPNKANLERHRIGENGFKLFFVGNFDILNFSG